jgi:hypothetical protein
LARIVSTIITNITNGYPPGELNAAIALRQMGQQTMIGIRSSSFAWKIRPRIVGQDNHGFFGVNADGNVQRGKSSIALSRVPDPAASNRTDNER